MITRSLELKLKKTTRTMKTLEGQLVMLHNGERTSMSSRVAELDTIMPQTLGVATAILDNVIFCHQDESLWPMSEPSALKKKFDEIFEALKYTKAIDNIKLLRKNLNAELNTQKALETVAKADKDKGDRVKRASEALHDEIEQLKTRARQINAELEQAAEIAQEKRKEMEQYAGILSKLEIKRTRATERESDVADLKTTLDELPDSSEQLQNTLAEYEDRMMALREQEKEYVEQYRRVQEEVNHVRATLQSKLAEQGNYQARKENHERQIELRKQLVQDAAREHAIRGYEGALSESQIQEFVEKVSKLSREKKRELERIQAKTQEELREAQSALAELRSQQAAKSESKKSANQSIAANNRNSQQLQREIDRIPFDEGAIAVLESSHKELKANHEKAIADQTTANLDEKLRAENNNLRDLEAENERIGQALTQSMLYVQDRAELEHIKKELKAREHSLDAMIKTHKAKIAVLVGDNWRPDNVEVKFQRVLGDRDQDLVIAQKARADVERQHQKVALSLSTARETRKRKHAELKNCEKKVCDTLGTEDDGPLASAESYPDELERIQQNRDQAKSDLENYQYLAKFWRTCIKTAERQNICHVCERNFDPSERSPAVEKLRAKQAKALKDATGELLAEAEEELQSAREVGPQYESYMRLKGELPALDKDITELESQSNSLLRELEEKDAHVQEQESIKRDAESLSNTISNIIRYAADIRSFEEDIERLSTQQKSSGVSASVDDLRDEQSKCNEQLRAVRKSIEKLKDEKERLRNAINNFQFQQQEAANKLSKAQYQLEKKQGLVSQVQALQQSNADHRKNIEQADEDLESLVPQLQQASAKCDDITSRGHTSENRVRDDSAKLSDTVHRFNLANSDIEKYIQEGGPGELARCRRAIENIELDIKRHEEDIQQITNKANKIKKQVGDSEQTKRNIADNLRYRRNIDELRKLQADIAQLESQNADEDHKRLTREVLKWDSKCQRLTAERGPIMGSIRAKDDELGRLVKDYDTDYKDARAKYREAHIKVETTKAAIEDLGRYGTALDQAIMKYHSLKMEEINRIAGELWQSTYKGTDVDKILIRSEPETTSKRAYNYRVCMVKGDAEMDMRGRCSAGQKVLASIIIRLALAECFGVKCGVSFPWSNQTHILMLTSRRAAHRSG